MGKGMGGGEDGYGLKEKRGASERVMEEYRAFGQTTARLRREPGLSQQKMARRLHIGVGSLRRLGRRAFPPPNVSSGVIFRIDRLFGVVPREQFRPSEREP